MFTSEDRGEIHLSSLKAQLLRARVEDDDQNDPLSLDGPVREGLRAASGPVTRGEARFGSTGFIDVAVLSEPTAVALSS
jgi:hypothetical protein